MKERQNIDIRHKLTVEEKKKLIESLNPPSS